MEPWLSDRHSFYEWANSNGYEKGLQLDRTDNDGPYSPDNCRWVTHKENSRNRSTSRPIDIDGEVKLLVDWLQDDRVSIKSATFYKRKAKGMSDKDALFTPPDPRFQTSGRCR